MTVKVMSENSNSPATNIYNAVISRRTIRCFKQKPIPTDVLKDLVNAARVAPSAANLQPLEYIIITEKEICSKVFDELNWAAYISPNGTPAKDERPTAYIVILTNENKKINKYYHVDVGTAAENIMLTALEFGLGSCLLCSINRYNIRNILKIPNHMAVYAVVALGYPAEQPVVEELTDSVKYWKDKDGVLHVPKRKIDDILHMNKY